MIEIRHKLELSRLSYFETHLGLMNCILPQKMTPTEIKVIASFLALEGEVANYRFGPTAKKIVREQLGISPAGLSNYMASLTEKGFLTKIGDLTSVYPLIIPEPDQQLYMFKLINTGVILPSSNGTHQTQQIQQIQLHEQ